MWFVLAVESAAEIASVIVRIEAVTNLPVYAFPKEREFFVELKLPLFDEATDEVAHGPR